MSPSNCPIASSAALRIDCATAPALPLAVRGRINATFTEPLPSVLDEDGGGWALDDGALPKGSPPGPPAPVQAESVAAVARASQTMPLRRACKIRNIVSSAPPLRLRRLGQPANSDSRIFMEDSTRFRSAPPIMGGKFREAQCQIGKLQPG